MKGGNLFSAGGNAKYNGLNKNGIHGLICLNICFPFGGTFGGDMVFLEKVLLGAGIEVPKAHTISS